MKKRVPIKFVFFDLDDTLIDTTAAVLAAYETAVVPLRDAVIRAGLTPPSDARTEDLLGVFGSRLPAELFAAWLIEAGLDGEMRVGLINRAVDIYWPRARQIEAFGEAKALLDWLSHEGIGLGLITDGRTDEQLAKIENAGLTGYFGPVFVSDRYRVFESKPGQAMYRDALMAAGAAAPAVMFVGDRDKDVIGANISGMTSVRILQGWVNRRPARETVAAAVADYTVRSLAELLTIIPRHSEGP